MNEAIHVGIEREGSSICLALRTSTIALTLSAPIAAMSAICAALALGVQPDTGDSYTFTIKGSLDASQKAPRNESN